MTVPTCPLMTAARLTSARSTIVTSKGVLSKGGVPCLGSGCAVWVVDKAKGMGHCGLGGGSITDPATVK